MDTGILVGIVAIAFTIALSVVGIVVAIVINQRSLREKRPRWAIRTNNLVSNYSAALEKLQILYDGQPVDNLSVSNIAFWNEGKKTIRALDLDTGSDYQLRLVASPDVTILNVERIACNNDASDLEMTPSANGKSAPITLRYLDYDQGAVFRVTHDGTGSDDLRVEGKIQGVFSLPRAYAVILTSTPIDRSYLTGLFLILLLLTGAIIIAADAKLQNEQDINESVTGILVLIGMVIFIIIAESTFFVRRWRLRQESAKLPLGLETFFGDLRDYSRVAVEES